jgi:hypothetical protein
VKKGLVEWLKGPEFKLQYHKKKKSIIEAASKV